MSRRNGSSPILKFFSEIRESLYLLTAALTVTVLAQNVYSQQSSPALDIDERSFAGDRSPGILEEPSQSPTGPNADLYAEIEREFEASRPRRDAQND